MDLDLTDVGDSEQATRSLREWCTQLGYRVKAGGTDINFLLQGGRRWIIGLKANPTENHRIIATCVFRIAPNSMERDAWLRFVNQLNSSYNLCTFCVNTEGHFEIQYNLPFLDKLSPRLFRNFINYADGSLGMVMERHEDVLGTGLQ